MKKLLLRNACSMVLSVTLLGAQLLDAVALSLIPPPEWVVLGASQKTIVHDCDPSECEHAISWRCDEAASQAVVRFPSIKKTYEPFKHDGVLYLDIVVQKVQLNSIVETSRTKYQIPIINTSERDGSPAYEISLLRNDPLIERMISASNKSALARLEVTTFKENFGLNNDKVFIPLFGLEAALSSFWEGCNEGKIPVGPIRN